MKRSLIFLISLSILPTMINAAEIACGAAAVLGCLGIGGAAYRKYNEAARDRETVQNALERMLLALDRSQRGWAHENHDGRPVPDCIGKFNAFFGYDSSFEEMQEKYNALIGLARGVRRREEERGRVALRRRSLQHALDWVERIERIPSPCICPLKEEPMRSKVLERLVLYEARLEDNLDPAKEKRPEFEKSSYLFCNSEEKKYQEELFEESLQLALGAKLGYQILEQTLGRTVAMRRPSLQKAFDEIDTLVGKKHPEGLSVSPIEVIHNAQAQQLAAPPGPVAGQ